MPSGRCGSGYAGNDSGRSLPEPYRYPGRGRRLTRVVRGPGPARRGRGATRRGPSSRRPSGRAMWPASIKARGAVLKSEKRERTSPSKDWALGQERRFREGSGRTAPRLVGDAVAKGVHRHFRLLLRLPHPDVQGAALDFFLADHDNVGNPLLFRVPDFLPEGIVRVVEVGADALEAGQEGLGIPELVLAYGHDPDLWRREPDGQHRRRSRLRRRGGLLKESIEDPLHRAARREMEDHRVALLAVLVRERDPEAFRVLRVDLVRRQGRGLVVPVDEVPFVLLDEVEELLGP